MMQGCCYVKGGWCKVVVYLSCLINNVKNENS
jgi:hypothetical protein